jgi:hypothetical protein
MRFLAATLLFGELLAASSHAHSQTSPRSDSASAVISGIVADPDGNYIPGASVSIASSSNDFKSSVVADANGRFTLENLNPGDVYHLTIAASGFEEWKSPEIALQTGQHLDLDTIAMKISAVETSVTAVFADKVAAEQIRSEEQQRILGVIPNFYVVYGRDAVPMPASLKFKLALRAETDVVTFSGAAMLAGINQAAGTPAFPQGAKGYAQRFGVAYAGGATDVLIGEAILPSLLHQDPRYFYSGQGTRKQRLHHALRSVFLTHGDNGTTQFNYSGIGGDLASAALANAYYPPANRGPHLFLSSWGISTGGRILNVLVQEFVLRRYTTHPGPREVATQ